MKLTGAKATRSPARSALADAIILRDQAATERNLASEALASFNALLDETQTAWFHAENAVEVAKKTLQEGLRRYAGNEIVMNANAMQYGLPPPRQALASAEAAFVEHNERLTLGKEGRPPLEAHLLVAKRSLASHEDKVMEAVHKIEQERLPDLLAAARAHQAETFRMRSVIRHIGRHVDGVTSNWNVAEGLGTEVRQFLNSGVGDNSGEAIAPWQAAREALSRDPDAELPA